MKYKVVKEKFIAPNGAIAIFSYREGTNDRNTIVGAFCEDKYGILDLKLNRENVVFDIGAHIGAVTVLLASLGLDLQIFAYEPVQENFDLLLLNIEDFKRKNRFHLFNEAVWFYPDDKVKMYYGINSPDGKTHKFIGSQFIHRDFYDPRVFCTAPSTSLSKAFNENSVLHCEFMKLDAERAEYGILKAAPPAVLKMIEDTWRYHMFLRKKLKAEQTLE